MPFDIQPKDGLPSSTDGTKPNLALACFADGIATWEAGQRKIQLWLHPEDTIA
jgi:hypothetical protein